MSTAGQTVSRIHPGDPRATGKSPSTSHILRAGRHGGNRGRDASVNSAARREAMHTAYSMMTVPISSFPLAESSQICAASPTNWMIFLGFTKGSPAMASRTDLVMIVS